MHSYKLAHFPFCPTNFQTFFRYILLVVYPKTDCIHHFLWNKNIYNLAGTKANFIYVCVCVYIYIIYTHSYTYT